MPRRFILWDIDGTLLRTGSVGRLALEHGARRAGGLTEVPEVAMGGKTDPQIVREILELAGVPPQRCEDIVPVALAEAQRILAGASARIRAEGTLLPGVKELLAALERTEGVRQSLLTGNLAPNAGVKVQSFGIEGYFDFPVGAYGTDDAERDRLVPIALRRVLEHRGERYAPEEVWVVGDTPYDLRCARAGGVRALIVGTGPEGFGAVRHLDADALVRDLADTDRVLEILLGAEAPAPAPPSADGGPRRTPQL